VNKQHLVVFLQNAWSEIYAGGTWPRPSWLRALERSRSGQRLKILVDDLSACENTTPIVGATPAWIRDIVEQCADANVPCFVKQLGADWAQQANASHKKGGNPAEWPSDLRVRQVPHTAIQR
jgi:hypothetical protein